MPQFLDSGAGRQVLLSERSPANGYTGAFEAELFATLRVFVAEDHGCPLSGPAAS
jgi:hypothetical protein